MANDTATPTPQEQLNTIVNDPAHAYNVAGHPDHEGAVKHVQSLYQTLNGETPAPPVVPTDESPSEAWNVEPIHPEAESFITELPTPPEGEQHNPALVSDLINVAEDLGASREDAKNIYAFAMKEEQSGAYVSPDECVAKLQKDLGEEQAEKVIEAARLMAKRLPFSLKNYLEASGLGNSPSLVKYLGDLGAKAMDAQKELEAILGNSSHPYWVGGIGSAAKAHEDAVKHVARLQRRVHGSR